MNEFGDRDDSDGCEENGECGVDGLQGVDRSKVLEYLTLGIRAYDLLTLPKQLSI